MAMKNYKIAQEDGTDTYYQFDDTTDEGKAALAALNRAVKDSDNPVKSVSQSDPKPVNS